MAPFLLSGFIPSVFQWFPIVRRKDEERWGEYGTKMNEKCVILNGELSLGTIAGILLPLEPLWDPLAPLGPVHFDLSGVTFIWPAAITLLTTTVLRLRQDGFGVRITRPAPEIVTDSRTTGTTSRR